jgi:hypothetical protein
VGSTELDKMAKLAGLAQFQKTDDSGTSGGIPGGKGSPENANPLGQLVYVAMAAVSVANIAKLFKSIGEAISRFATNAWRGIQIRLGMAQILRETGKATGGSVLTGPYGQVSIKALEAAASSGGPTVKVITNLTQKPEIGRVLSTASGEAAEALAGEARAAGQLYAAEIPKKLLTLLEEAGLAQKITTSMGNVVGTEYKFLPGASKFIAGFFK